MKLTTLAATLVLTLVLAPSAPGADDAGSMGTCLPNPETATMVSGPGTLLPSAVDETPAPADEPTTSAPEGDASPHDDLNAPAPVALKPVDDATPEAAEPGPEASTRELMTLDEGAVKAMNEAQRAALKADVDAQIRRWSAFEAKGGAAEGTLAHLRALMSAIDGFTAVDQAKKAEEEVAAAKIEPATPPVAEPVTPPVAEPVAEPAPALDEAPPSNDDAPVVEFVDETPAPSED